MSRKKPTPNYQLMFESAVTGLQIAYSEYKKARIEALRWTRIDEDGYLVIPDDYEEGQERIENAEAGVVRLMELVNELRDKIGGDSE